MELPPPAPPAAAAPLATLDALPLASAADVAPEKAPIDKAAKREERKKRRAEKRKEREERWKQKRKAARNNNAKAKTAANKARRHARKSELRQDDPTHTVLFDLSFDEKMTDKEIRSLTQQMMFCRGVNRRVEKPVKIVCASMCGRTEKRLDTAITGFHTWKHWTADKRSHIELYPREQLVYLSGDAKDTLLTLEPDKVYIIGGIVDHNRHKGLTYRRATELGIPTARLPIDEFLKMSTRKILAVNHVFQILVYWLETRNWAEAFQRSLPKRKGAQVREGEEDDGGDGSDDEEADESDEEEDEDGDNSNSEGEGGEATRPILERKGGEAGAEAKSSEQPYAATTTTT